MGFISTRQVNSSVSINFLIKDIKIKGGTQKAKKGTFIMEQLHCPLKIPFLNRLHSKDHKILCVPIHVQDPHLKVSHQS